MSNHPPTLGESEGKPLAHPLLKDATPSSALVEFDGKEDPLHPINWPFRKKVVSTILYGLTTAWITFASAVYSAGVGQIAKDFDVSTEVAVSRTSLIVFGFGLGPLIWAPLSEAYGRKWVIVIVSEPYKALDKAFSSNHTLPANPTS